MTYRYWLSKYYEWRNQAVGLRYTNCWAHCPKSTQLCDFKNSASCNFVLQLKFPTAQCTLPLDTHSSVSNEQCAMRYERLWNDVPGERLSHLISGKLKSCILGRLPLTLRSRLKQPFKRFDFLFADVLFQLEFQQSLLAGSQSF